MPFAQGRVGQELRLRCKAGNETTIDYQRIMRIVRDAGYRGYVGIEFEGRGMEEVDGIRATQNCSNACDRNLAPAA